MLQILAQVTTPEITIPSFTVPTIVLTLVIATLCGALAQLIVGYTRGGCLGSILIGVVGALIGGWLAALLRFPNFIVIDGIDLVWTSVGAIVFVAALAVIMCGRRFSG